VRLGSASAAALQATVVVAAIGALGFAAQKPWLFPSLAPTLTVSMGAAIRRVRRAVTSG